MHVRGDSSILISVMVISLLLLKQEHHEPQRRDQVISYGDDEMTIKRINYVQSRGIGWSLCP